MLIGRTAELARLDAFVGELCAGQGGALFVHGEAGIGKTALLQAMRSRAEDQGVQVVSVRGVESEAELAFSSLYDLLAPLFDRIGDLPDPQAAALASALALAPPRPGDRLAVCVATLGLLTRAATDRPLLATVDDLPWIDSSSRECMLFAARRACGRLSIVLCARHPSGVTVPSEVAELPVGRLARSDSMRVASQTAPDLVLPVADAAAHAAAGNPLALIELVGTLHPSQRQGVADLPVPLSPGPRLGDAYRTRIAELSTHQRRVLLIAAAYEGNDVRTVAAACAAIGEDPTMLAAAEDVGMVRIADGHLAFVHPLARGAVYHGHPPQERRVAHGALADVLHGEQAAWHRAAATVRPDEHVAGQLEAAGLAAIARRGPGPASVALERAARLSPDAADFARRMLAAGEAAGAAALADRAMALLKQAGDAASDDTVRASAYHLYALTLLRTSLPPAVEILEREGARVASCDPVRAAMMLSDAAMAYGAASQIRPALPRAEHAFRLLGERGSPAERAHVLANYGSFLHFRGRGRRARPILEEAVRLADAVDPLNPAGQSITLTLNLHLWSGDFEGVRDRCLAAASRARDTGTLSALPLLLLLAADACYRLGDWEATDAGVAECIATSADCGQPAYVGHARAVGAVVAAARGDAEQARRDAAAVIAGAEETGVRGNIPFALAALGFLELGLGRIDAAIARLEELAVVVDETGLEEPVLIPWEADLVEAYLRAGRDADARRTLSIMGRRAHGVDTPMAYALHARCRGMVEATFDRRFERALQLDDERPMPFERARTLLAYGRRLHRVGRRAEARKPLHVAVASFERLGAAPWLASAEAELRAAGGRRRSATGSRDQLTVSERRVAATVARGLTNREVAAELFLSPKTVEFHLGQIYRKLGVRSRTQLAAVLKDRAAGEPAARP